MKNHNGKEAKLSLRASKNFSESKVLLLLFMIFACILSSNIIAQSADSNTKSSIKGRVTNRDTNEPIIGASVMIKGTATGTITNINGNFTLPVPANLLNKELVLQFSYIGYSSQDVKVSNTNNLNIELVESVSKLDEVVVVGYGTTKRSDLTGSVSSVDSKVLTESRVNSFAEALQGKVAGVRVNSQSGEPGATINIQIRGANSINAGTAPLYVIDGIPMDVNSNEVATSSVGGYTTANPLATINPEDIESIEMLKDASSAAIYGSRGANGVIIIATKSGKLGSKTTFNLNVSSGFSDITKSIEMLNAQEYVNYRHELNPTVDTWGVDTNGDGILDSPLDVSGIKSHNWQSELFRRAPVNKVNFSMQGGAKNMTFSGGLGYLDQKGLIQNNDYKSYSARFKFDNKVTDKLTVGLSTNWGQTLNTGLGSSGGGAGYWSGIVQSIYTYRPIPLVAAGESTDEEISLGSMIYDAYKETVLNKLIGNAYLQYKILDNLTFKASGGGTFSSSKLSEFYGSETLWGRTAKGRGTLQNIQTGASNGTATLDYWKKIAKGQVLKLMGGFELNTYKYETFTVTNTNFQDESTGVFDISKGATLLLPQSNVWDVNRMSFFGRVNYDINNKYLFTGTLRADGSSNFGEGNRFGYFPSMAFAWRVNQESFLKNIKSLSNLKLRLSYGVTGNDRITAYQSLAVLSSTYYSSGGATTYGVSPTTSANPDLKWETTNQYNVGIDLGMFKQRLTCTVDAYYKKTTGMLLNSEASAQTGFSSQWRNIGDMENKGIELTINTVNVDTKKFGWNTSLNLYTNKNKILNLGGSTDIPVIIENGYIRNVGVVREGESLGTAFGYIWNGIYQISDFTWQNNSDPNIAHKNRVYVLKTGVPTVSGLTVKPGDFKYEDLDENGTVNSDDRRIISNSNPKFSGGISNDLRYKNFTLSLFFEGVYGNQIFNEFKSRTEAGQGEIAFNLTKEYWDNRWTPENPSNRYASIANSSDNLASSYFVEDGSYLRFKTLSLSYQFDKKLLKRVNISNLKIYGSIDNVYVWTNYSGLDPDVSSSTPLLPGYDRISYPRARTITFGLDLTF